MRAAILAVAMLAIASFHLAAQDLHFEAASIKPSQPNVRTTGPRAPDVFFRNAITLRLLMVYAWDLPEHRIVGGPAWIGTDRFDIVAKANATPTIPQMRVLARELLQERFGLRVHTETREGPVYNLVLARPDGRLGPRLKPAEIDCTPFITGQRPMSESPLVDAGGRQAPRCGITSFTSGPGGAMTATLNGFRIPRLADYFERSVNRVVVDKTGLTTAFDVEVTFINEVMGLVPGQAPGEGPSLATAVQEQLGLKLESARGPAEFLVIDAVEKPSAN